MDKKIAVLTGGTSGIGMQTALALKSAGYTVYELSRRAQGVEGLNHLVADVTDEAAVKKAVDEIVAREGKIDVLVNNAGFGISGAVEFTKTEDAKRLFDTNFFGMVNMNRAVVPVMREAGQGRIVNISSVAGLTGNAGQANYSSSKAGVVGLTKTVARELASRHINCNAIAPGAIRTPMTDAMDPKDLQAILDTIPLGFMGEADDIAELAAYLASDKAKYITGEVIRVDGGIAM